MKKHFIAALMSVAVVAPAMVPVEAAAQRHDDRRGNDSRRGNDPTGAVTTATGIRRAAIRTATTASVVSVATTGSIAATMAGPIASATMARPGL